MSVWVYKGRPVDIICECPDGRLLVTWATKDARTTDAFVVPRALLVEESA